jgi:AcrR family transcriptional regulator
MAPGEERGFEDVTVAEIAERAGLTKRTFFRYFTDKREVLFAGAAALQDAMVAAVIDAPDDYSPIAAVVAAVQVGGAAVIQYGEGARRRQAVIEASTELRERELIKLAELTAALAGALQQRGVGDLAAALTAQAGIAVFTSALGRWVGENGVRDYPELLEESLVVLRAELTSPGVTPRPARPRG